MALANTVKIAYLALLRQVPVTFTFGVSTYTGVRGGIRQASETGDATIFTDSDLTIVILLSDYATAPVANDQITVSGISYRVINTTSEATGTTRSLSLKRQQ